MYMSKFTIENWFLFTINTCTCTYMYTVCTMYIVHERIRTSAILMHEHHPFSNIHVYTCMYIYRKTSQASVNKQWHRSKADIHDIVYINLLHVQIQCM